MASGKEKSTEQETQPLLKSLDVDGMFNNYESKENLVGFFNILLQVDKRKNPEKYKEQVVVIQQDDD